MVTIVLLKEAWTCTTPECTIFFSFFLNVFFLPALTGAFDMFSSYSLRLRDGFLLIGHSALAGTLAGTRVGVRALAAHRQVAAMPVAAIGADFDETLDIHRNLLAQI